MPDIPGPGSSAWDFRRGSAAARILAQVCREHGMTLDQALRGTGLAEADLDDGSTEIEAAQDLILTRNLLAHVGDVPGLGVDTGKRFSVSTFGFVGYAMLSSATLRDVLLICGQERFLALSFSFVRPELVESGTEARWLLDDRDIPEDVRPFFVERDVTIGTNLIQLVAGPGLDYRLELTLDAVRGRPLAEAFPGRTVLFGRPRTAMVLPRQTLDRRLPASDEHTARMCEEQCRALLERRRAAGAVSERVRARLLRRLGDLPSMDQVAAELHIDPRTLRRHLTREGTSFRALVDEVRETLAVQMLGAGLRVGDVARRLDYSETATFTHAFQRWRNVSPSEYQRSALSRRPSAS